MTNLSTNLNLPFHVCGIAQKTASAMLLQANCFERFDDSAKLCKFFGIVPHSHYSGSSIAKKGRITKFGASNVRMLLYNCTRSAIRFNPQCKALYQRLRRNGKPHKVAAVRL